MATLSAAERFGLSDRGAISPGHRADFCIVNDPEEFIVERTFRGGKEVLKTAPVKPEPLPLSFHGAPPSAGEIRIPGSGRARIVGLVRNQIVTESLTYDIPPGGIPDLDRDILKVVVCNRYRKGPCGVGLVHGFGFRRGAIATSVAHDAHNVIAVGTNDTEILWAIEEVFRTEGAMAAITGNSRVILPLDCAGLMSTLPYPEVIRQIRDLHHVTTVRMDGIENLFMYLSFLALTIIPALRVTDRGVFDGIAFRGVPLFP